MMTTIDFPGVGRFLVPFFVMTVCAASVLPQSNKNATGGAFRTIIIITQQNSSVWMDGVLFGKIGPDGRLEIKTVASGSHLLRVRSDGYNEKTQTLTAAQKGEISIPLLKTTDGAELAFQEAERLTTADRERSAQSYRKAIGLRPAYPEAYLGLARILAEAGDPDGALKALASARRLHPGYAEASAVEGRIQKDTGQEDKAVAAFKRAIAEGKGFQPEAFTGLGLLYKEKAEGFGGSGDFERENSNYTEAAKYFRSAITQLSGAPDSAVVYQLLGLVFERQKKFDEAVALYEEFLRLFPDSNDATAVRSFIEQIKKLQNPKN